MRYFGKIQDPKDLITKEYADTAIGGKAAKAELSDIFQTGSTCTEANGIAKGVFFYLDNELVVAKTAIANGATFTLNTNYEYPSAGALNALKSALTNLIKTKTEDATIDENGYFTTTLPTASAAIIAVTYFKDGNLLPKPYRYEILNYGGDNVDVTALRFFEWDGTILGKNSAARVTYKYIDL